MSKYSDIARLEFIMEMIEDIEYTITQNGSVTQALSDRSGKHALMMCLLQIGETLNKIESPTYRNVLPVKGAYDVRNFIAHDYEGVDLGLIDHILRHPIPELKSTVKDLLKEC